MRRTFFDGFSHYSFQNFRKDLFSGLIVGIIAIPLGMAFAIASGVKPEYGIYTTFIAGILISLFGGSKYQIGGPTGAFVPVLLGIVMTYGYENLLLAGFKAGIMLFLKTRSSDSIILAITFLLTVFTNLTFAVEVGLVLAAVLFVKRMSDIHSVIKVLPDHLNKNHKVTSNAVKDGHDCPQISILTVEGALFFGAAQMFENTIMSTINHHPKVLVLRMGKVPYMDTTGESYLKSIVNHFRKQNGTILLSGIQDQPKETLLKTGLYDEIGESNFFEHTGDAINFALTKLDINKCLGCKHFAFQECTRLSSAQQVVINDMNSLYQVKVNS